MRVPSPAPETTFVLGVNLPWSARRVATTDGVVVRSRAGWDFGPCPPGWGPSESAGPRAWSGVRRDLEVLRGLGVRDVRFFVLANGVNYPAGERIERFGTLARRGGELRFRLDSGAPPPRLPDAFVGDFEALLWACTSAGVRLWPSLLSFELFEAPIVHPGGIVSGGRGEFVFGRRAREASIEAFLDATLSPLLDASRRVPGAIGAFEVMNEPDWVVRGGWFRRPVVRPSAMSRFILLATRRIVDAGFIATVGFADADPRWLGRSTRRELVRLGAAGAYVHQLHHYPGRHRSRRLAPHAELPLRPCLVGELATAQGTVHPSDVMRWGGPGLREHDTDAYLAARLERIERLGYPGAFVWGYHSTDPATEWGDTQAKQLRAFARARPER